VACGATCWVTCGVTYGVAVMRRCSVGGGGEVHRQEGPRRVTWLRSGIAATPGYDCRSPTTERPSRLAVAEDLKLGEGLEFGVALG
jgi:hypothetical protein